MQQCAELSIELIKGEQDEEIVYRLLCAMGTVGCADSKVKKYLEDSNATITAINIDSKKIQEAKAELGMLFQGRSTCTQKTTTN
jgi:hypothetical protein